MDRSKMGLMILLVALLAAATGCSKGDKPAQAASAPQANPPAATQPASAAPAKETAASNPAPQGPSGPRATDKYVLDLTDYANVPVTVKLNGQWVGQWDNHVNIPLDMVVKGENQLTVDLASEPKNTVTVNINTVRDGQGVSILSLNYKGQSGSHTSTFVAR
jgi:hypothetical protein